MSRYRIRFDRDDLAILCWDVFEAAWENPDQSGYMLSFETWREAWDWLTSRSSQELSLYHDALKWRNGD